MFGLRGQHLQTHKGVNKQGVGRYSKCLGIARGNESYTELLAAYRNVEFGRHSVLCSKFVLFVNAIIGGFHTKNIRFIIHHHKI